MIEQQNVLRPGLLEMVKLLLSYGADKDVENQGRVKPVHLAQRYHHESIVALLQQ